MDNSRTLAGYRFDDDDDDTDNETLSTQLLTLFSTTPRVRPIETYYLQEFSWAEPLLNTTADALVLQVNGTDLFLKLSKDAEAPVVAGEDAACAESVVGGAGVCKYLTRCDAAKNITTDTYRTTYCSLDGYAGVCCSPSKVDKTADTTAVV